MIFYFFYSLFILTHTFETGLDENCTWGTKTSMLEVFITHAVYMVLVSIRGLLQYRLQYSHDIPCHACMAPWAMTCSISRTLTTDSLHLANDSFALSWILTLNLVKKEVYFMYYTNDSFALSWCKTLFFTRVHCWFVEVNREGKSSIIWTWVYDSFLKGTAAAYLLVRAWNSPAMFSF